MSGYKEGLLASASSMMFDLKAYLGKDETGVYSERFLISVSSAATVLYCDVDGKHCLLYFAITSTRNKMNAQPWV